jgi:hypothetical protein
MCTNVVRERTCGADHALENPRREYWNVICFKK